MNNVIRSIWILSVLAAFVPEVSNTNQQSCPAITESPNISYKYIRDNIVNFSCSEQEGYQLYGQRILVCLNGKWNHQQPVCVKEGCPPLPEIAGLQYSSHPIYQNAVITLTCGAGYIREGPPTLLCIGGSWSDVIPTCVKFENEESTCDFEEQDLCGWSHDNQNKLDWALWSGPTRTNMTGPQTDHTLNNASGKFLHVDKPLLSDPGDKARLFSPIYRPTAHVSMCLNIYIHMCGEDSGNFSVYIIPETVPVTELNETLPVFSLTGNQGDQWLHGYIPIPQQSSNYKVVFELTMIGNGVYGDVAIDDVSYARCDRAEADIPRWTKRPTSAPSTTTEISTTKLHTSSTTQPPTSNTPVQQRKSRDRTSNTTIDPSEAEITSKKIFQEITHNATGTTETTGQASRNTHSTASNAGMQTGNYTNAGNYSANSKDEPMTESLGFQLGIAFLVLCILLVIMVIILLVRKFNRRRSVQQNLTDQRTPDREIDELLQTSIPLQNLNPEAQRLNDRTDEEEHGNIPV